MAAPNLKTPSSIIGKIQPYSVTDTLSSALSNPSSSGKCFRINSITAANLDTSLSFDIDVSFYRSTTHTYLCKTVKVDPDTTLVVRNREELLYLEEGDALYAKASSANKIDLLITYEEIS